MSRISNLSKSRSVSFTRDSSAVFVWAKLWLLLVITASRYFVKMWEYSDRNC